MHMLTAGELGRGWFKMVLAKTRYEGTKICLHGTYQIVEYILCKESILVQYIIWYMVQKYTWCYWN